jgi:hypothetical protein
VCVCVCVCVCVLSDKYPSYVDSKELLCVQFLSVVELQEQMKFHSKEIPKYFDTLFQILCDFLVTGSRNLW